MVRVLRTPQLHQPFPKWLGEFPYLLTLDIQTPIEEVFEPPDISILVRLSGVPFTPNLTRYDWRILDV